MENIDVSVEVLKPQKLPLNDYKHVFGVCK